MDAPERGAHVLAHLDASTRRLERSALGGGVVRQCAPGIQNERVMFGIDGLWLAGEPMLYGTSTRFLRGRLDAPENGDRTETGARLFCQEGAFHGRCERLSILPLL